jgi:DNA-binding NarL/FixJ family response regulator
VNSKTKSLVVPTSDSRLTPDLSTTIRVSIVEDDPEFRQALVHLLNNSPGLTCASVHGNAFDAMRRIPNIETDIVLMDLELPQLSGVECIWQLKATKPQLLVMVLTRFNDTDLIFDSLKAGAKAYLLKRTSQDRLVECIFDVYHGGSPMTPEIARKVLDFFDALLASHPQGNALTSKQKAVLRLARQGLRPKDIAEAYGASVKTIRTHFRDIYDRLQVHKRAEAVQKFFQGERPLGPPVSPARGQKMKPQPRP